jgi:hypothetical protein
MTRQKALFVDHNNVTQLNEHFAEGWLVKFAPNSTFVAPTGKKNEIHFVHGSYLVILEREEGISESERFASCERQPSNIHRLTSQKPTAPIQTIPVG